MNLRKIGMLVAIAALVTGCSCKRSFGGMGNIGLAEAGKVLKDVHFAYDSYTIDSAGKSILDANAAWLKEHNGIDAQIEGHCDERGTNEYNMVLGMNRARGIQQYVSSLGIAESRMSTVSYGEELPLDPEHDEAAWAKNRRGHFSVSQGR
mgnify:CR=1 FL=1